MEIGSIWVRKQLWRIHGNNEPPPKETNAFLPQSILWTKLAALIGQATVWKRLETHRDQ
jgi:hypothetical protein